jgi:hypothetical protein
MNNANYQLQVVQIMQIMLQVGQLLGQVLAIR